MFRHRSSHGPVDLAFTDRFGGVSAAPYAELNLALDGDDPAALAENLRRVQDAFGPGDALRDLRQVHGARVVLAGADRPEADGVVTADPGITLMVRAADCVPVLLADPEAGVIGAAHAGRAGLVAGVAPATVERMRELGARTITAWVGPSICGACYEVPLALQAEVGRAVPAAVSTTSWGTPALDVAAGVDAQLRAAGVEVIAIDACTREDEALYSYRRDGAAAGRQAGLIRVGAR